MGVWTVTKIVLSIAWVVLVMMGEASTFNPMQESILGFFGKSLLFSAPVWLYWGAMALWPQQMPQFLRRYSVFYKLPLLAFITFTLFDAWHVLRVIDWNAYEGFYMVGWMVTLWLAVLVALFFPVVSAWKRFLARAFDYMAYGLVLMAIMTIAKALGCETAALALHPTTLIDSLAISFIVVWSWTPIEAWLTQRFGTTPGKALLGVELHPLHKKTTYLHALKRSVDAVLYGMGGYLPGLNVVAQGYAYFRLWRGKSLLWNKQAFAVTTPTWTVAREWQVLAGALALWAAYSLVEPFAR